MKKFLVITTIAKPNKCLKHISKKSIKHNVKLIIVGDKKSPNNFYLKNSVFLNLKDQKKINLSFPLICPVNSYARKNIGYLYAIKNGAKLIFETDDDNKIMDSFFNIKPLNYYVSQINNGNWVNVYNFFSDKILWPRGFPLEEIKQNKKYKIKKKLLICPINQRLVDKNPDFDAVYRLTGNIPINFKKNKDIALGKNSWCTFNSQNTIWFSKAFPLLYLPSYSSFRMSDIWRSLIAQRICWENNWNILFSNSTAIHERNDHNLLEDFKDEIPGYLNNANIAESLKDLKLKKGEQNLCSNLYKCYQLLCKKKLINKAELKLLNCWIKDLKKIQNK